MVNESYIENVECTNHVSLLNNIIMYVTQEAMK